jgi:hypothetical protein
MKDHVDSVIVKVIQDPEDPDQMILDLGLELCQRLGWQPGDQVDWFNNGDGSWTIKKIS